MQGIEGRSRNVLLQVLNNTANRHLRERLEGEIFSAFEYFGLEYSLSPSIFDHFSSKAYGIIYFLVIDEKIS
ncbi:MAG: hypothetical protein ABIK98_14255 [Pseudomonadota bacterium]